MLGHHSDAAARGRQDAGYSACVQGNNTCTTASDVPAGGLVQVAGDPLCHGGRKHPSTRIPQLAKFPAVAGSCRCVYVCLQMSLCFMS
jgi:hypothetical protein